MKRILLAGATGYLGSYIAKELQKKDFFVKVIVRNPEKLKQEKIEVSEIVEAKVTQPESIKDCCDGVDVVISTIGITRQKDGLTYMDVDYQANLNLLHQAQQSGVKKFIYVSALNGENLKHLKIFEAKEKFVEQLKKSGVDYCVVRPHGFFSDMSEFYHMAKKGRIYLFGNGKLEGNPIHGEDLAEVCVDAIENSNKEINIGGPEVLTHNEIAITAFDALGKKPKITHLPDWLRVAILKMVRTFTGSKIYGPIEFFLTVMAIEMIAPQYGKHTLKAYYSKLRDMEA
jgi:uncharacterized protein YbjT (DUF2867 family)